MSVENCHLHVDDYEQRVRAARDALRAACRREESADTQAERDAAVGREIVGLCVQFYECAAELDEVDDVAAQLDAAE